MKQLRGKDTIVDSTLKEVKAHGTEGFPFAVYLNDFSSFKNDGICWHWHDEVQITLITEGEFACQAGGEKVIMHPGEIIFFNSCGLHQITPVKRGYGKLYSFIWRPELLSGTTENDLYENCIEPLLKSPLKYVYFSLEHPLNSRLRSGLRKIINLMLEKEPFFQMQVSSQLTRIWLKLCECADADTIDGMTEEPQEALVEKDEEKVKKALSYIQEHYAEKISLEAIAKAAMTNRSELCKCFRRILDTTPNDFLNRFRVNQSLVLLENPGLRVVEIAEMVGFCSSSHFGTNFAKYMGCTPVQYRKTISM